MKQYKVIKCNVDQLEERLNVMAKDEESLSQIAVLDKGNIVVVMEKSISSEDEVLPTDIQQ